MQDKEFDQLFRDKFEEAGVTPSSNLWANIEEKLEKKPKRIFPVYWSAAAAVLLAVTLGLLFNKSEKTQSRVTVVAVKKIVDDPAVKAQVPEVTAQPRLEGISIASRNIKRAIVRPEELAKSVDNKVQVIPNDPTVAKKDLIAMQPSEVISHPDHKEPLLKKELAKSQEVSLPVEEVVLASADLTKGDEENENKQAGSGRIRNVGDLVNYVVDKVDKREEKFIQFKTDDDESSLISLNIGMFRFNQKKHK